MATATLTSGDVARLKKRDEFSNGVVLRVQDLTEINGRKHKCQLSDGSSSVRGILASQLADLVNSGDLANGCLVKITNYILNTVGSDDVLVATDLEVVAKAGVTVKAEPMDTDMPLTINNTAVPETTGKPAVKPSPSPILAKENSTPGPSPLDVKSNAKTPGGGALPLSPIAYMTPSATPSGNYKTAPTPPSMGVSDRKNYHCIQAMNPYRSDWCLKVKLSRKGPLRSTNIKGSEVKILTVDLIDETGQQIQGTFWRGAAERYADQLIEGRVYVINRMKVKPADKKYSTVKCDYQIDFMDTTEVSEAADQEAASAMTAAVEIVPIAQLPRHVGGRRAVDVMGLVLSLAPLGTVKRKADSTELPRRDMTLGDSSGKSVVVTLWGENATGAGAALDGTEGKSVVQVTQVRVTDYNGCSCSSLAKSVVTVDPSGPAAQQLLLWYSTADMAPERFTPVGQDMAGARGGQGAGGGQGAPSRERFHSVRELAALGPDALEGDKALFHPLAATVAMVPADQNMYYLANPENGRKVVDQGGGRYTEADGRVVERPEHRYVLSLRLADHTGEMSVQLFNKEAEAVLGLKADELAAMKASGDEGAGDAFAAALRVAQWRPWSFVLMSKAREYNGERRVRHTAHKVEPLDWAAEAQRLVTLIGKYDAH